MDNFISKRMLAVNGNIYAGSPENPATIIDSVRRTLNKYWFGIHDLASSVLEFKNKENEYEFVGYNNVNFNIKFVYGETVPLSEAEINFMEHQAIPDSPFGTSQKIRLEIDGGTPQQNREAMLELGRQMFIDQRLYDVAVINGDRVEQQLPVTPLQFIDAPYQMQIPFTETELRYYSGISSKVNYSKIKSTYNFFSNKYENALNAVNVDSFQRILPNLYIMTDVSDEFKNDSPTHQEKLLEHTTLFGTLSRNILQTNAPREQGNGQTSRSYFSSWADGFNEFKSREGIQELMTDYQNLIYSRSKVEEFELLSKTKFLFPMYVDVEFTTETTTEMAEMLKNSKFDSLLIRDVVESNNDNFISYANSTSISQLTINSDGTRVLQPQQMLGGYSAKAWDVIQWWLERINTIIDGEVRPNIDENFLNFGELMNGTLVGDLFGGLVRDPNFRFLRNILSLVFGSNIKTFIEKHLRTAEEILNGELAYSETVFYEIRKGQGESTNQSFFIPNSNDIDVIKYVDTQVGYATHHSYEIIAYQLVVGNRYQYSNVQIDDDRLQFDFKQVPFINIIETPYVPRKTVTVMDKPPLYPDVNLIPYKGTNDQLLIWLNHQVGEIKEIPVILQDGDLSQFTQLVIAQDPDTSLASSLPPLCFRTDDPVDAFEVFRIENKPIVGEEYESFIGRKYATIPTQNASSAAMIDRLVPNKKYYYTFRAIDNKGHVSNPTSIYEVELVENGGAIYPLINIVCVFAERPSKPSIPLRKYVQIKPTFTQTLITDQLTEDGEPSEERPVNLNVLTMGQTSPAVWDKKFKFRFTSKKTGKMIDINVTFKKKKDAKEAGIISEVNLNR